LEDSADEWLAAHERIGAHRLAATAAGDAQNEADGALLEPLERQLMERAGRVQRAQPLRGGHEPGDTSPQARPGEKPLGVDCANRLHCDAEIAPPLILGHYRRRS